MDFGQMMCEILSKPPTHSTANLVELAKETNNITEKVIIAMLTENTGAHFLDSGGAYGRAWQRRQKIENWDDIPYLKWNGDYMSKSLYRFLVEQLDYDPELDKEFHEFCINEENKKESYYACMHSFKDYLEEKYEPDGSYVPSYFDNSYNHESAIDGTIQYQYVSLKDKDVIILQTHNGCDVRGGYSTPHVFTCSEGIDYFSIDSTDMRFECSVCGSSAYTDDAYNWYLEGPYINKPWDNLALAIEGTSEDMIYDYQDNSFESALICPICGSVIEVNGNNHELTLRQRFDGIKYAWVRNTTNPKEKLEKLLLFAGHVDMCLDDEMVQELKELLKIERKRVLEQNRIENVNKKINDFKLMLTKRYWRVKWSNFVYRNRKKFNRKYRIWKLSMYDLFHKLKMNEIEDKELLAKWYFLRKKHGLAPNEDEFWKEYNLSEEELCQYKQMSQKTYNLKSLLKLNLNLI